VGNKSVLTFPLKVGGAVVGGVSFGSIRRERSCSERDLQRMRLVAEVFGNALERKRAVAQIRRLDREMHQISRVAMMGELTVSLAHELNQPLGAILNNAQAARRWLSSEQLDLEEIGSALDDIMRDNTRAVEIVKQVRALFQKGEVQKTSVDLRQVLMNIEVLLRNEAMVRGISFRLIDPEALPTITGQSTQLMQLLLNLTLNAFDAICESESPKREVVIHAAYQREQERVRVSVMDSGKGIDPGDMPRLFDAFFTTKKNGIGLGLAIAQSIVQNHGGQLWAVQNPDQGATMIFEIPVAK
jgi:two-component system, LuxR family, sensor kinase FixL